MIGQANVFKGRFSATWGEAREMHYASNLDTYNIKRYSAYILATILIKALVEMSLELWVARNKKLHGSTHS